MAGLASEILEGREAFAAALTGLIEAARQELALTSQQLERPTYERAEVLEALKQFALRSTRSRLRVLVADVRGASAGGNLFLEFAHRLPSRIELRELNPVQRESLRYERLIADRRAVLQRETPERLSASLNRDARHASALQREFDELWEFSEPSPELRKLSL